MSCDIDALTDALQSVDPDQQMEALGACMDMLTDPALWYAFVAFTIVCALVGALIGRYKNAIVRDTLLGLALGPIGWVISLLLPAKPKKKMCAACANVVEASDKFCRHCGAALP